MEKYFIKEQSKPKTPHDLFIEELKNQLKEKLSEQDGYEVFSEYRWGYTSARIVFDLVVKRYGTVITVFEVTSNLHNLSPRNKRLVDIVFFYTPSNYLIFCDYSDKSFLVCVRKDNELILDEIKKFDITSICDIIKGVGQVEENKEQEEGDLIKGLKFYSTEEKHLDPNWCREQLKQPKDKIICRYSSLDSLFCTLKYKTFRMNGLPGMNDKEEGLFAWKIINNEETVPNEENKRRKRAINDAFIVSLSEGIQKDKLTLWRLYGDDAKGVCCVYSIKDEVKDRFFLHKVNYIDSPIEDKLLNQFKLYSDKQTELNYADLSPAIFFYKPKAYEVENEVRLLVDNKKTTAYKTDPFKREWCLTNSNHIPNPYIDIPLDVFPLKLEKIFLGPNMNDVDTIQAQLEEMLSQQGMDGVEVELSKIKSYRNPQN